MKHAILFLAVILLTTTVTAWDISTATYVQSFNFLTYDENPSGVFFKPDGSVMYFAETTTSRIYPFNLSTLWDVSTAVNSTYGSVAARDIFIDDSGTRLFVTSEVDHTIKKFGLSTPWDVSTAGLSQSIAAGYNTPTGLHLKSDGLKMYVVDSTSDTVREWTMTTPWDLSSAAYTQNFSVATQEDIPTGLTFSENGSYMYVIGSQNDYVRQYTLSTAWNVTTATYTRGYDVADKENQPTGLYFSPSGSKMYIVGITNDQVHEYDLETTETSASSNVRFVADWDGSGTYNTNYSTGHNLGIYGGTVYADSLMQDLTVYVKTSAGTLVETLVTDNSGKIYPATLVTGTYYNFEMSFLGENISNTKQWTGDAIDIFRENAIIWEAGAYDAANNKVTGVTFTLTSTPTGTTQTKTARGSNNYALFYSTINTGEAYSLTATKTGLTPINYYNQGRIGSQPQDFINPWVQFGALTFFMTNEDGEANKVTILKAGDDSTDVTAGEIMRKFVFKLYDQTEGFLTSKDFTVDKVEIIDDDSVCNEERLDGYKYVCNWADYNKEVGIPTGCEYVNDWKGEYLECASGQIIPYYEQFTVQDTGLYTFYHFESCFSTYENILSVMKMSGIPDKFCLTREGTGTCYTDYYCTEATNNTLQITLTRKGVTHLVGAEYEILEGALVIDELYARNTTNQRLTIPITAGNAAPLTTATTCALNLTMADASVKQFSSFTIKYEGGRNLYETDITPTVDERAMSYAYSLACSGGGYAETLKSGTVYVSSNTAYYTRTPTCIIKPRTISDTGSAQLFCEVWTSENATAITIQADKDVGVGETLVTLELTSSEYFGDNGYLRQYSNTTDFDNTADGNSYTVNFVLTSTGYSNQTIAKTLTIDNDVTSTNITDLRFSSLFYSQGETASCTVTFTGTNFNSAKAEIYSHEYKDDYDNGIITGGQYNLYHYKYKTWDASTAPLIKIGHDTYQLTYEVTDLKYCADGDTQCFEDAGLSLADQDTLICDFTINYETEQANASFNGGSDSKAKIKMWLTQPTTFMSHVLGLLLNPIIFAFMMFIAFIIVINKRGN